MEPSALSSFADVLAATGPYGLLAVIGWGFWAVMEKKDRSLNELSQQIISMATAQTEAISKVGSAILMLKEAIDDLRHARK